MREYLELETASRRLSKKNVSCLSFVSISSLELSQLSVEQNKQLNMKSLGGVILPQLTDTLKNDIMERIASKTLTEVHVAVAPSVSFE